MNPLLEGLVAFMLLMSGVVVFLAGLGLWRLPDFFLRMHSPALASTLGAWIVTLASILYFSARTDTAALHVWLTIIILSITAPVTTIVLARAALFRRRRAGDPLPPRLRANGAAKAADEAHEQP